MLRLFAAGTALVTAIYWYLNRHKPIKHILKELWSNAHMQCVGFAGLLDDKLQGWRNKMPEIDRANKVAVITGGARGIGKEVIRQLLKANCIVIAGLRDPRAIDELKIEMNSPANLLAFPLDLNSQKSVREFAKTVTKMFPEIHLLVNNAGIMFGDYRLTEDGVESQFAINYLSHFLLTHLLLPALKRAGAKSGRPSRVVNVSSCGHYPASIDFEDINMEKHYDTTDAYARSKLAQIMSVRYINKQLEDDLAPVRCFSVHPGVVNTDLFDGTNFKKYFPRLMDLFFKSPAQGAIPILYACFSKELDKHGGLYISNCREGYSNYYSKNKYYQHTLHITSCNMVGISVEEFGKQS